MNSSEKDTVVFSFISIVFFFVSSRVFMSFKLDFWCSCIFKLAVLSFNLSHVHFKIKFKLRWYQNRMIFINWDNFHFHHGLLTLPVQIFWFARRRATTMQFQGRGRWENWVRHEKHWPIFLKFSLFYKVSVGWEQINFDLSCIKIEFN